MTKHERLENIRDLCGDLVPFKEAPESIQKLIMQHGLTTGSVAFGVASEDSDIDVVIDPMGYEGTSRDFFASLTSPGIALYLNSWDEDTEHYWGDGFYTLYVKINDLVYNLILPENELEFERWVYATTKMIEMCKRNSEFKEKIRDKDYRVEMFEQYKAERSV